VGPDSQAHNRHYVRFGTFYSGVHKCRYVRRGHRRDDVQLAGEQESDQVVDLFLPTPLRPSGLTAFMDHPVHASHKGRSRPFRKPATKPDIVVPLLAEKTRSQEHSRLNPNDARSSTGFDLPLAV
jgi:hypothetical protein